MQYTSWQAIDALLEIHFCKLDKNNGQFIPKSADGESAWLSPKCPQNPKIGTHVTHMNIFIQAYSLDWYIAQCGSMAARNSKPMKSLRRGIGGTIF
jgi:hypothetical protein